MIDVMNFRKALSYLGMLFWGWGASAFADPAPKQFPGYSNTTIQVFEQDREPYTLPYDSKTTYADSALYEGTIQNVNGSPATGAGFFVIACPNKPMETTQPVQIFCGAVGSMKVDQTGRFRFLLKHFSFLQLAMDGTDDKGKQSRSQETFDLQRDTHTVLTSRLKMELPLRLIKENGQELDRLTTPTHRHMIYPRGTDAGECVGLIPRNVTVSEDSPLGSYGDAQLRYSSKAEDSPFTISSVAVPGDYSLVFLGRIYKPFSVKPNDTELTVYEDSKPFVLRGSVVDPLRKPVPNAFVMVSNEWAPKEFWHSLPISTVEKVFTETSGDFDKLGCYLTKTDKDGRYVIRGNSIGSFSTLLVKAEGRGLEKRVGFIESPTTVTATSPFQNLSFTDKMYEGELNLPPIVSAKTATLKMTMSINDKTLKISGSGLSPAIHVGDVNSSGTKRWEWWNCDMEGKAIPRRITVSEESQLRVPAEVPFELWLYPVKSNLAAMITVTEPLEPGELREMGVQQLEFKPVRR